MFRRFFTRAPSIPDTSSWWRQANDASGSPTAETIAALAASTVAASEAPDQAEAQEEMIDGLRALLALDLAGALPVVDTQHRVIGEDRCHYLAPASRIEDVDVGGKLLVTSARLIFVGGGVHAFAWHQVSRVQREDRDLVVDVRGRPPVRFRLNSYEGALVASAIARRLSTR